MSDDKSLPATATGAVRGASRLAGRRVLVVGAGSKGVGDPEAPASNGRAIAVLAAREGAAVAVVDVVPEAAEETVQLVEAEGGTAATVIADVADPDQCDRLVDEADRSRDFAQAASYPRTTAPRLRCWDCAGTSRWRARGGACARTCSLRG